MTLRQYLLLISMGSGLAWATWLMVLFTINPFEAGGAGFALFYIALAVALLGTISLVGFAVRFLVYRHERVVLREVTTAFRQAFLLTLVVIGSLLLQSRALLAWWNILLFVVLVSILELFFLSSRQRER
jgi:hypothetical protein